MPNAPVAAAAGGLSKFTRRLFLRSAPAAAMAAVAIPAVAGEPEMSPREKAYWHMRELLELLREDGAGEPQVLLIGSPAEGGYSEHKAFRIGDDIIVNRKGMFGEVQS